MEKFKVRMPTVEVCDVTKNFGTHTALSRVSLSLFPGECAVVCGPNGSGKSTLLRCIAGLETPDSGSVIVHANKAIGFLSQKYTLFRNLTVIEDCVLPLTSVLGMSEQDACARAEANLERVGVVNLENKKTTELSGGEQQRVAIATMLGLERRIMLFDEPASSLDPLMTEGVLDVIADLAKSRRYTVLVVTHRMGFAERVADSLFFMEWGKLSKKMSVGAFFEAPPSKTAKAFVNAARL